MIEHIGHDFAWREWYAALAGPRMHHAWLLTGQRGIGKMGFALQAARELVKEEGVPQPAADHPDILILTHAPANADEEKKRADGKPYQTKRNISVDQIRTMQHRLNTRPTLGSRRAIIVDPADDMEKSASNALLKSLEEPPVGSYFLLVSHRPGRLLPTIRSRCRILRFPTLSTAEIDNILRREAPNADETARSAAVAASAGSPGAALDFVELELGKLHQLMADIAQHGDPDFTLRGKLADSMGARPDRKRQLAAIDLARSVIGNQMESTIPRAIPRLTEAYADLNHLANQAPTYNFDPGLLIMEIGTLLASLAAPRDMPHG
ncbi:DNA polymerase III subunit delta' [Altericroceibacterium spongiae]|uniref:DNA polymerase III subunit delta n=1 Tax=Altericroceibacterium spongiae TaxID=2320269 RepID=A0A420ERW0_9SPHN|nr:DNA polymerase III subunit delta' [Altericroceibacterium spongiae]RKF23401.1 DNA polymerase III subunit delta' [Altericroceibacterium spongiae]